MRSSARNRSYAAHRLRLASCDSYFVRSLLVPTTLATPAACPSFSRFFAALCPSPAATPAYGGLSQHTGQTVTAVVCPSLSCSAALRRP